MSMNDEPLPPLTKAEVAKLAPKFKEWDANPNVEVSALVRLNDPDYGVVVVYDWTGLDFETTPPEDAEIFWLKESQLTDSVVREFQKHGITLFDHMVAA